MIILIYFSVTGNTKYLVDKIRLEGKEIISIEEALRQDLYNYTLKYTRLGISI